MRKKYRSKIFIVLICPLVWSACGSTKEVSEEVDQSISEAQDVNFRTMKKGILYGAGEEGLNESIQVIKNEDDWKALKDQMDAVNNVTDAFADIDDVDFEHEMVVACFDKVRSTGGYSMFVERIVEMEAVIKIDVQVAIPSGMNTSVLTQPFVIVVMEKSDKSIERMFP